KKRQNPAGIQERLDAHTRSLFSESETTRSRRQKSANGAGSSNHNIMGFGVKAAPTGSGNNRLKTTRLFVVLGPFLGMIFSVGRLLDLSDARTRTSSCR